MSSTSACNASASIRRAPSRTSSSINAVPPSRRVSSASAAPGTTVSTGRTFPTGVGAPTLLEGLQVIGRVRPLSLIHRSQALLGELSRGQSSLGLGQLDGQLEPGVLFHVVDLGGVLEVLGRP